MAARNAIETAGLTKRYGTLTALDNVTFEVARGELFGLIGPDGAGKTTLFRLLTTLINPDGGTASVDGCDIVADYREIRRRWVTCPGDSRSTPTSRSRRISTSSPRCSASGPRPTAT